MRLWSIHPKYLDSKGLVALWREALLAKKVLEKKTKGYVNHPQLNRFKSKKNSILAINFYLYQIYLEAKKRRYSFNKKKIGKIKKTKIRITREQINYEFAHLKNKLKIREVKKLEQISKIKRVIAHPIFLIVPGKIEEWEIIKKK